MIKITYKEYRWAKQLYHDGLRIGDKLAAMAIVAAHGRHGLAVLRVYEKIASLKEECRKRKGWNGAKRRATKSLDCVLRKNGLGKAKIKYKTCNRSFPESTLQERKSGNEREIFIWQNTKVLPRYTRFGFVCGGVFRYGTTVFIGKFVAGNCRWEDTPDGKLVPVFEKHPDYDKAVCQENVEKVKKELALKNNSDKLLP